MANNAANTVAAINAAAAAAAIGSTDPRYTSPEEQGRWKSWWSGLWCFGSQKGGKRIAPTSRTDGTVGSSRVWTTAGPLQAGLAVAPPSSPASFVNSSVQSPASFSLSLAAASANVCSPSPTNTMFTIGPYAHETQLVSPPVFSTFTTEPSTAPFTPPPELAHVTTPSSPDVPFARLVTSSLEAKNTARETVSPFSSSPLASPGEVPAGDLQGAYQLYPGSPVGHLVSPMSCISGSGTPSPAVDIEFPAQLSASFGTSVPSFPNFEPFTHVSVDQTSSATLFFSHKLEGSKQKVVFPAANFSRYRPDLSAGLWKNSAFRGESSIDVPLAESLGCHSVSSGTHEQYTKTNIFKHVEALEESTRDEEKLDGFCSNGTVQNKWNIFHVESSMEDSGRPRTLQDLYTNVVGAALAKRENIGTDKWRQHANSIVEENWRHPVEGLPILTTVGCPDVKTNGCVSGHPVAIRDSWAKDSNGRKVQEEVNGDSCVDFHESLRAEAAIRVLSLSATSSPPDLRQDNLNMHLGNNSELSVSDLEARGCQNCGDQANRCSKLSAGLEQANESLEV